MIKYWKATKDLPLILNADESGIVKLWVDGSIRLHPNMWGHTAGGSTERHCGKLELVRWRRAEARSNTWVWHLTKALMAKLASPWSPAFKRFSMLLQRLSHPLLALSIVLLLKTFSRLIQAVGFLQLGNQDLVYYKARPDTALLSPFDLLVCESLIKITGDSWCIWLVMKGYKGPPSHP